MNRTIQPLKPHFSIDEDAGFVQDQIKDRVNSEDNLCWALGWPIIKTEDIKS